MSFETGKAETEFESSRTDRFEAAFREYWGLVYQIAYRLVGHRFEAEELAADTFWRLYRQMRQSPDLERVRGWLCRVAVNLGLNALRSRRRRSLHEDAAARWISEDRAEGDPLELATRAEARLTVRLVLSRLKPRSARLLSLRYSGLSYSELADALGIRSSSVGVLLARAHREFRAELEAVEHERKRQ